MERWWVGMLWLIVLGLILEMVLIPSVAAAKPADSTPSTQNEPVIVQVKGTVVNLRAGPGLEHEVLDQVQQGDKLQVTGISADQKWLQIIHKDQVRWIYSDLTNLFDDIWRALPVLLLDPVQEPQATTESPLSFVGEYDNRDAHWQGTL